MAGFTIGVNAIRTATQLIDMAGDNIANANTPGYHVKRADVVPVIGPQTSLGRIGLGSAVEDVTRVRNELIEKALLMHTQTKERLAQEIGVLDQLELLFTEPSDMGLDARLGEFFDSVTRLAADPSDPTLREAVVQKASSVTDAFQHLDEGFDAVADDLLVATEYVVNQVNALAERIAALNGQIKSVETSGISAPGLKDTRDQLISQLAELINISVYEADYGVANVSCAGTLLVDENRSSPIRMIQEDGQVVIAAVGGIGHRIPVREGRLAGLVESINNVVPRYQAELDELADAFRRQVNLVHTTAIGAAGRFHSLEGANALLTDDPLSDLGYGVPAGTSERLVINVEDESTGEITQYELTLDTTQAADAFLISLRDAINASVGHVTASISEGKIHLDADEGYAFDFAIPYDPDPAEAGDITALNPTSPSVLDAYTGDADLSYGFTFLDGSEIGTDAITIQIEVRDSGGSLLRTLTRQIDADYDPGGAIELENGLRFTLSAGNVAAGDGFSFVAYESMDTAGVLDALGLNTLFNGLGAGQIEVAQRVYDDPLNLAGALRPMEGDNHRFLDLAAVRLEQVLASGTAAFDEYYRALVSNIATTRNTRSVAYENQQQLCKDLENRRDSVSGVSVDEEMVRIVQGRTLYQGALKYISVVSGLLEDLMGMV